RSLARNVCLLALLCATFVCLCGCFFEQFLTTEAQRRQRLHTEQVTKATFRAKPVLEPAKYPRRGPKNLHAQDPAKPRTRVLRFGRLPRIHWKLVIERAVSGSLPDRVLPERARRRLSPLLC